MLVATLGGEGGQMPTPQIKPCKGFKFFTRKIYHTRLSLHENFSRSMVYRDAHLYTHFYAQHIAVHFSIDIHANKHTKAIKSAIE